MKNQKIITKISKNLSLILRHNPAVIGLKLDENGWADVKELIAKFSARRFKMTRASLEEVVATNNKKRFSFNEDKTKIRANQGHSISVDLEFEAQAPPSTLFHGTVERFLTSIFTEGLIKGSRQHVHLSADLKTAQNVGSRRGNPIILKVNSLLASQEGIEFYLSDNGVWLSDHVPVKYLERL